MEAQKNSSSVRVSPISMKKAFRRFENLKEEFFRIQWTEDCDVVSMAKIVVLATFICGMVLYLGDLIVQRLLTGIDMIFRLIFG